MSHFALLWKARTIEKYRLNYEREKLISIKSGNVVVPQKSLFERLSNCHYDAKERVAKSFRRRFPEGSQISNLILYLRTDQTFPNFVMKSVIGFVGGIVMTYLLFMFFVFQLSISLIHATIMSSVIGVLLTLGLAFSYRIRCLVFLLIPQFFSRVGRYTLTCYALILILTGPATNTLRNSEVLSESMACSQEQLKTSINEMSESINKPYSSMKDTIKTIKERVRKIAVQVDSSIMAVNKLALSVASVLQSSLSWLNFVVEKSNKKMGTSHDRCKKALQEGMFDCHRLLGPNFFWMCNVTCVNSAACLTVDPLDVWCTSVDFIKVTLLATVRKRLQDYVDRIKSMFHVAIDVHHTYSYINNGSRSASQVAAGIVTEIRSRADPLLTWLSWSSCITSLFLLLIIFRAKYYQHMFETRSRFDNRYVTKELYDLDLKRTKQGKDTILPLNRREKAKYVTTTSFRLVASEKLYLTRSAVFMTITTFKLMIHMVADYSLYWVLTTIRHHGRFQTPHTLDPPDPGIYVTGTGPVADILRSIIEALFIPIVTPGSTVSCLPDPYPPDLQRYAQIGVLIFLLWFFALFEPYGLRMRHVIMGLYRPERAKARAVWLYNHILRTRGSFLKSARRKLHQDYKYHSEEKYTFQNWVEGNIPCYWIRYLIGYRRRLPSCLLCGTTRLDNDPDTILIRCEIHDCPGIYCGSCFNDIGRLCTICMSPADYGDLSDMSFEKGSSEDSDNSEGNCSSVHFYNEDVYTYTADADDDDSSPRYLRKNKRLTKHNEMKDLDNEQIKLVRNPNFIQTFVNNPTAGSVTIINVLSKSIACKTNNDWTDRSYKNNRKQNKQNDTARSFKKSSLSSESTDSNYTKRCVRKSRDTFSCQNIEDIISDSGFETITPKGKRKVKTDITNIKETILANYQTIKENRINYVKKRKKNKWERYNKTRTKILKTIETILRHLAPKNGYEIKWIKKSLVIRRVSMLRRDTKIFRRRKWMRVKRVRRRVEESMEMYSDYSIRESKDYDIEDVSSDVNERHLKHKIKSRHTKRRRRRSKIMIMIRKYFGYHNRNRRRKSKRKSLKNPYESDTRFESYDRNNVTDKIPTSSASTSNREYHTRKGYGQNEFRQIKNDLFSIENSSRRTMESKEDKHNGEKKISGLYYDAKHGAKEMPHLSESLFNDYSDICDYLARVANKASTEKSYDSYRKTRTFNDSRTPTTSASKVIFDTDKIAERIKFNQTQTSKKITYDNISSIMRSSRTSSYSDWWTPVRESSIGDTTAVRDPSRFDIDEEIVAESSKRYPI